MSGQKPMTTKIEYRQVADDVAAAHAALELVLQQAMKAITKRGRFIFALSGGTTPKRLYQLLAATDQDWSRWHLLYADERCLPDDNAERTTTMVESCWLDAVDFPTENHYKPAVELGAEEAASNYAIAIEPLLPIDLALLGMGEDGHTASLFPGHTHPDQTVVPVHNSPKPPADRISLSYVTLCNAATVCFLVTGPAKQKTLARWLQGDDFPVAHVIGKDSSVLITDIAADSSMEH